MVVVVVQMEMFERMKSGICRARGLFAEDTGFSEVGAPNRTFLTYLLGHHELAKPHY
jgi:hypothetical protein